MNINSKQNNNNIKKNNINFKIPVQQRQQRPGVDLLLLEGENYEGNKPWRFIIHNIYRIGHNYFTPKLKRHKPLQKLFKKSKISRQNYFYWAKTWLEFCKERDPPNSNWTGPCEKVYLSLGGRGK